MSRKTKKTRKLSVKEYSENYLNITCKTYPPHSDYRKYIRGGYVLKVEYRKELMQELGDSGFILFQYYYDHSTYNYFKPDDNKKISDDLGWSTKKVERIRKVLKDKKYLMVLKDTSKDGSKYYRVLMGKGIVEHYLKTGNTITEVDIVNSQEDRERLLELSREQLSERISQLEKIVSNGFPTEEDVNELNKLLNH